MNKSAFAKLLVQANAFAPMRFFNRGRLLILMYHRFSIGEEWGKTSRAVFEQHLSYLTRNYNLLSLDEAIARIKDEGTVSPRSALITVDDGYQDFIDVALPALQKFCVPAALYVVTGFVDRKCWIWTDKARFVLKETKRERLQFEINGKTVIADLTDAQSRLTAAGALNAEMKKLEDGEKESALIALAEEMAVDVPALPPEEFAPISWEEAERALTDRIAIGSHTETHPILTNVDNDRLNGELRRSKARIEEVLGLKTVHFCYPNGNVSRRERDAAEAAGYASAVTTELRLCEKGEDKFLLPRIDAEPEMHRFVQATSGFDRFK